MNKNVKGLIAVAVVAVIGYFVFKKFVAKPDPYLVISRYLDSSFGYSDTHSVENLKKGFDKAYIQTWSEAIMQGKQQFTVAGKTYWTLGGESVTSGKPTNQ